MKTTATPFAKALGLLVLGLVVAALGIYIGDTDDAPGAALIGLVFMIGMIALAARTALRGTGR